MLMGHRTSPGCGNMQHCILYLCFLKSFLQHFISEWLTAPHLQSLCSIHASALCCWVPLGGTWEHKALSWVGCKLWSWGNNLPCGVYYSEFLDFFPVWGEHSANHRWLCGGEDVYRACGHRPLLHRSTMGLAQIECVQGPSMSTKLRDEPQVQL